MRAIPRRVWVFAALLLAVVFLPYLVGYLNAPPGGAFTGNAVYTTRVDYNSHLAKMQLGLRGEWLYHLLFTPEEHPGILIQTFYVALGHVARLCGCSPVLVYHLARAVCTLAMVIAIWLFAARWLADDRARWMAFLLAIVTGGLGWVLYFVIPAQTAEISPIEFWLLDAYTFLAALTFPHFSAAIAALLAFFLVYDRWLEAPGWRQVGLLTVLSLLLGWIQPFDMLLTALVVGILTLLALAQGRLHWARLWMLLPVAGAHVLVVGYHFAALNSHPVWQSFNAQNVTLSPPPLYYIFGYGWLLIPAVVGVVQALRERETRLLLPTVWVLVTAVLVYLPLPMQRRFLMGVQVPLAVLAAVGLMQMRRRWLERGRSLAGWERLWWTGLLLSAVTHVLVLVSTVGSVNPAAHPALFMTGDEVAALDWLRQQPPETVTLAAFDTGGKTVGHTGRRTYLGHWMESIDYPERKAQVAAFFAEGGMSDAARRALLREAGIDYVWYDDAARALGNWPPGLASFLRPAFVSDTVTVYEVLP